MIDTLRVLLVLEAVGLAALPAAILALGRLGDGWAAAFAKPLGFLAAGWLVWAGGRAGIPNGLPLAIGAVVLLALGGAILWPAARRRLRDRPGAARRVVAMEVLTAGAFLAAALFNAFAPDVWGTEKPMDMSIVNTTIVSPSYPPQDPWLAGADLNYYYLGHLCAGVLIRLAAVEPSVGYNLALAAVFAMTVGAAFALAAGLARGGRERLAGAAAVVLVALVGNVRGGLDVLRHDGPLERFDWFGPSRVVPDTINEFPFFSFLLGDLHAHVLAIPLTILAAALAVQLAVHGPPRGIVARPVETAVTALAVMGLFAVSSWSWPLAVGLLVAGALGWARSPASHDRRGTMALHVTAVLVLGALLMLAFAIEFEPPTGGPGLVDERRELADFLADQGRLYGILLWALIAVLGARLAAARHPERVVVWGTAGALVAIFLLAEADLAGAGIVAGLLAISVGGLLGRNAEPAERGLWLLVAAGLTCVLVPEVIYVRDEFDDSELFRMNTVFKLGLLAWLMLALAGGAAVAISATRLPRPGRWAWGAGLAVLVLLGGTYTVAGSYARKRGFAGPPSLEGRAWLPAGDVAAIDWLREQAPRDAVVLEAVGDDYSAFGHARISTFSGRPTLLGWPGHELQYGHDAGTRDRDAKAIYTASDPAVARRLLRRYGVRYVVVGQLERTDYGDAAVIAQVGRKVFEREGTAIYELPPADAAQPDPGSDEPAPPVLGGG